MSFEMQVVDQGARVIWCAWVSGKNLQQMSDSSERDCHLWPVCKQSECIASPFVEHDLTSYLERRI